MPVETRLLRNPFRKTVTKGAEHPRKEFIATVTGRDKSPQQDRLYEKKSGDTRAPDHASVVWRDLGDGFGRRKFFRVQRSDVAEPELMTESERGVYVTSIRERVQRGEVLYFSSKGNFTVITNPTERKQGWRYHYTNGWVSRDRRMRCVFFHGKWWSCSLLRKATEYWH